MLQMTKGSESLQWRCFRWDLCSLVEVSAVRRCRGSLDIGKVDIKAFVVEGKFPISHTCIIGSQFKFGIQSTRRLAAEP